MKKKFDKLRKNWFESGYNGMLMLPVKTELTIKGGDRHIITHRGVSFVWINGNQDNYPLVVIPLKNYGLHIDHSLFDYNAYDLFLEYLSLLSLINWNTSIDILHRSFKGGYLSDHFHDLETLVAYYPRVSLSFNLDKQEFRTKKDLTSEENLILSLFREGNSSENIFHSYLSFFRIFEFLLLKKEKGKNINDWSEFNRWIDTNIKEIKLKCLTMNPAMGDYAHFTDNFNKSGKSSIGDYLRVNCRVAIAHGKLDSKKVKAPNSFKDYQEIQYARSFIKAAAYLIVHEKLATEIFIKNNHMKY